MGFGRAGSHHNAVQAFFLDHLHHFILGVLGAGKQILLHIDHTGKMTGIGRHRRDIHNTADVGTAVTHKYPYFRGFIGHFTLFGLDNGPGQ